MLRLLFLIGVCPKESWPIFKNALQGTGLLNRTTGNIGRVERRKLAWPSSMTSMETVGHNFPFFQPPTGGLNPRFEAKNISSLGCANGKLTINWKMNEMLPGIKWHDVACHHEKPIICEDEPGHLRSSLTLFLAVQMRHDLIKTSSNNYYFQVCVGWQMISPSLWAVWVFLRKT